MPDPGQPQPQTFEKLGVFYLGREYDLAARRARDDAPLVLYDSKDLVTHAVCVGMTGSGKTGLCIGLLEEAALDGVPAIVIDPKGDLANLLLTFPDLRPQDFRPWINEDDARRKGVAPDAYAAQQAELWRKGLAAWGQDGDRIRRMREAADYTVYTPGSTAGVPVSILKSFAAPSASIRDDAELLQERIGTTATSLLALVGVDADPIQSREHILLSTLLAAAWQQGRDLDIASLIQQIQSPPVQRVGVIDLDSFFPAKDRFVLAMRLNNLLAAPAFQGWMSGEPLDIAALLHTPTGKPRVSIFSIAHLGDAERMFFVSLLLNQVVGWTRQQEGTTSLRAIVYMDEIFGYFPPVANPPSKGPLLTLLKQARAFGVGVVLATQNPVDLDYKGLGNAGTWFIGRLQTDRDKARVLDGLEGAAAGAAAAFDRARMEQTLAGLGSRVFLMNNVHEDAPVVFETRWAMSYLRGPLTRDQIRRLTVEQTGGDAAPEASGGIPPAATTRQVTSIDAPGAARPVLAPEVPQVFIPVRSLQPQGAPLVYQPCLLGCATVHLADTTGTSIAREVCLLSAPDGDWRSATEANIAATDLEHEPADGSTFAEPPPAASSPASYTTWSKSFAEFLYRTQATELLRSRALKLTSRAGESERDFQARLRQAAHEQRDAKVEALRKRYGARIGTLQDRIRRAEQTVARESEQASQAKYQTAISVGSTLLGALFGRRRLGAGTVGRAGTAARGAGRAMKESQDVGRARENVAALQQQLAELEQELAAETDAIAGAMDEAVSDVERIPLRPKKSDVSVKLVALAWVPHWHTPQGATPAWA